MSELIKRINFLALSEKEIDLVLSWRNDVRVKKWMHKKDDISREQHLSFIKNLVSNSKKDYFLVKQNNEYIGVIDLNDEYLGIYANPDKKRVGDLLLKSIINFAFDIKGLTTLKAEVYKDNLKAIKLYERFGFIITDSAETLLTMELTNETR